MVLSKIHKDIQYPERKGVEPDDLRFESMMYEIKGPGGVRIVCTLGKPKREHEKSQNLLYFPLYLVTPNDKVLQIGVYEIKASDYSIMLDDEGDLDLEKVSDPLFYAFATEEYVYKNHKPLKAIDGLEEELKEKEREKEDQQAQEREDPDRLEDLGTIPEEQEIPEGLRDVFVLTRGATIPRPLKEETEEKAKQIHKEFHESPTDLWIHTFMKNPHYDIIDNEGAGDCFFATIRDAFSSIARQTTVSKLRKKLATEVTQEVFERYKDQYDMYRASIETDTIQIREWGAHYKALLERYKSTVDRAEKIAILKESKDIKAAHDQRVKEKKVSMEMLNEFKWMKGIETLESFRTKIQSCEFWADEWAIQVMESVLNVKFIVLSSENWRRKDLQNILVCGSAPVHKDVFIPDFYIIVEHTGEHYKLISYKKKQIFTYSELPFDVRHMVYEKCMERNAGTFSIIPPFVRFKREIQTKKHEQQQKKKNSSSPTIGIPGPLEDHDEQQQQQQEQEEREELGLESKVRGLYNDNTIFQFYSGSNDKPLPGKGAGEKINQDELKSFSELATIPQWRKKLSNDWVSPFTLENHKWASVEHYYQAVRYRTTHPDFYLSFSLDSGTALSRDPEMAVAAGTSKLGKHKGELLRPKEVKADPAFVGAKAKKEMYAAQYAKFVQNDELKQLLLATRDAKLVHFVRGYPPVVFDDLMQVRDALAHQKEENK